MTLKEIGILSDRGFEVICESPFELSDEDGGIATGWCAEFIKQTCVADYEIEKENENEIN